MAAQRREAERQAKEQARLAREQEKAPKEEHFASRQRAAEAKTAAVEQQVKELDEVLTSVLPLRPVSFAKDTRNINHDDRRRVVAQAASAVML